MPVVASAMAKPIQSPAIATVVSFCTGDDGMETITALRLTAIIAVRTVVPIRSSTGGLRVPAGTGQLSEHDAVHDQEHRHQHGGDRRPWHHLHCLRAFAGVN